jgi:hypothetical protein
MAVKIWVQDLQLPQYNSVKCTDDYVYLMSLSTNAIRFIGEGNWSTKSKPFRKSLTIFYQGQKFLW